jgi:mono/diheme cytochrome c family protein
MKNKILIILFSLLWLSADALPVEEGKALFMSRCASCHNVNKQLVGPALAGIDERRPIEWITKFIHSSQSMIKAGDTAALALYQRFNKVPMPDHNDLSENDIKGIVEFIRSEAKPANADIAPFAKPGKLSNDYRPLSVQKDYVLFGLYFGIVFLLVATMLFAVRYNDLSKDRSKKPA